MADVTTMKVSTATHGRLRALRGDGQSLEDVVVALDAFELQQFWLAAEAASAAESAEQRASRRGIEAEVDAWMHAIG